LELGLETLRECPGFIHADNLFKQEYLQRSRGLVFEGFHDCFVPLSSLFLASVRQLSFALGSSQILCPFFSFFVLYSRPLSRLAWYPSTSMLRNYCKDHAREKVRKNALPNLSKLARVCLAIIPAAAAHRIQLPLPTSQVFIF
jgi:hypothetical protein